MCIYFLIIVLILNTLIQYSVKQFTYSFSMLHDGDGNDCPTDSDRIMNAYLGGGSGLFQWSNCSADYLNSFLK